MAGDLWQTPDVSWLNVLARAGSASIAVVETLSSATPKTRLYDGRLERMVANAASAITVRVDRGDAPREPFNRVVLANHNLAGHLFAPMKDTNQNGLWTGTTYYGCYTRPRGSSLTGAYTIHPGMNVIDFAGTGDRYVGVTIFQRSTNVAEIGELLLTRRRQLSTSSGLDPGYQDPTLGNLTITTLRSGVRLIRDEGPALRQWAIETIGLSGADLRLFERMLEDVGFGRDLVLFDGTRGGYAVTIDDFESGSVASWSGAGTGAISASTTTPYAGTYCARINGTAPGAGMSSTLSTALDLRNTIFRAAFRGVASISYLTGTTGVTITLGTDASNWSAWTFGTNYIASANQWYQLSVDLEVDTPAASSGNGCDPSAVSFLLLTANPSSSRDFDWDDLYFLRKELSPILARVEPNQSRVQVARNPSAAGEWRKLGLRFLEAI